MADQHVDLSEDLSGSLVATCVSLLVLSWVAVGLRTYTRAVLMKSFMSDDWLMVIAQVAPPPPAAAAPTMATDARASSCSSRSRAP